MSLPFDRLLRKCCPSNPRASPVAFAIIYAHLGEKDEAFDWLEKAFEEGEDMSGPKVDPDFDPFRDDPRFHDLLRQM